MPLRGAFTKGGAGDDWQGKHAIERKLHVGFCPIGFSARSGLCASVTCTWIPVGPPSRTVVEWGFHWDRRVNGWIGEPWCDLAWGNSGVTCGRCLAYLHHAECCVAEFRFHFGHFGEFPRNFVFGPFWPFLARFGPFWTMFKFILGRFGHFWEIPHPSNFQFAPWQRRDGDCLGIAKARKKEPQLPADQASALTGDPPK